ncbi:hypothetical protein J6590_069182 [Homalodisca vitripennis]|nr:hypothetical protein J6590_069182 [Homalodisca vitripennis]
MCLRFRTLTLPTTPGPPAVLGYLIYVSLERGLTVQFSLESVCVISDYKTTIPTNWRKDR